jgi:FtsP/CotA-like multicopper oxidase with cupredoxin domain
VLRARRPPSRGLATPALVLAAGLVGCGGDAEVPGSGQPAGWDDELDLVEAVDENPDPDVVEIRLEARVADLEIIPGTTTEVWTYDGALPGPLVRAKVGDRLIVHFENSLPAETSIHWHGLRVPVEMDGVPGASGPAIGPGEAFVYDFTLRDPGLYWYHPHVDSAVQVASGLYGAIVVDDPSEGDLGDEVVLVLSDIDLNDDGSLATHEPSGDVASLFGREGNRILVNGRVRPTLRARPGLRHRWRMLDAAISRYFQLDLAGLAFERIGGDGGLAAESTTDAVVVLAPGQRADVLVTPDGAPGAELPLRWLPYDRG